MLGELIGELKGKVMGLRVLEVESPTTEIAVSFSGNFKDTSVRTTLTFVSKHLPAGILHGKG